MCGNLRTSPLERRHSRPLGGEPVNKKRVPGPFEPDTLLTYSLTLAYLPSGQSGQPGQGQSAIALATAGAAANAAVLADSSTMAAISFFMTFSFNVLISKGSSRGARRRRIESRIDTGEALVAGDRRCDRRRRGGGDLHRRRKNRDAYRAELGRVALQRGFGRSRRGTAAVVVSVGHRSGAVDGASQRRRVPPESRQQTQGREERQKEAANARHIQLVRSESRRGYTVLRQGRAHDQRQILLSYRMIALQPFRSRNSSRLVSFRPPTLEAEARPDPPSGRAFLSTEREIREGRSLRSPASCSTISRTVCA